MSKFCNIDDWETTDIASMGIGAATDVCCPGLSIGFSMFMSGEAGTPTAAILTTDERAAVEADRASTGRDNAGSPVGKGGGLMGKSAPRNVFDYLDPPKPNFARVGGYRE